MAVTKLSEVPVVEKAPSAYVLIEEEGEIKRLPMTNLEVARVQADLSEDDPTKASFVHGKEDFAPSGGGGANVITYTYNSGLYLDGVKMTDAQIYEAWRAGNIMRLSSGGYEYTLTNMYYYSQSGTVITRLYYLDNCGMYNSIDV